MLASLHLLEEVIEYYAQQILLGLDLLAIAECSDGSRCCGRSGSW